MKKIYITPQVEIDETIVCQMMALSLQKDPANDSEVLNKEEVAWDMWTVAE